MAGPAWVSPSGAGRWRTPAIVAASLGLHAVVLGYIGFKAFTPLRYYGETGVIDDPIFPWPTIYAEIEPRPLLPGEAARTRETPAPNDWTPTLPDAGTRRSPTAGATGSAIPLDPSGSPVPRTTAYGAPSPPADVGAAAWRVRPGATGPRLDAGPRVNAVTCASPGLLSPEDRILCDSRFAQRARLASPVAGTDNADRDARFARQGARALARYEARRAPLSDADDPPCDKSGPIAECELEIHVDLFSSTRGWLPNLRGDDDD